MQLSRRDFLISSLAVGAGVAALPLRLDPRQTPLKIGFIGLGARGQATLACMATESCVRITAICDTAKTQVEKAAHLLSTTQWSNVRAYSDPLALLRNEKTDFVVISVPPHAQRSIFRYATENGGNFALETPILPGAAVGAEYRSDRLCIQLLPKQVLACCDSTPHFLLAEPVNTVHIIHRPRCVIPANTGESLKSWLVEELGDSLDAAANLVELANFDDCKSLSCRKAGNLREFVFQFSRKTSTQIKRLNINVTAPLESSSNNRVSRPFLSPGTFVMVENGQGRFCARTISRPESSTRLYLSNLGQAIAENSPSSLFHPLSIRLASYSFIDAAVNQLAN